MQPRMCAVLAAACLTPLLATPARAAEEHIALRWDAPASCPVAAFRGPLQRYLDARPSVGATLQIQVQVRQQGPQRWQLDLDIVTDRSGGTRQLTAERCETLADAAAFIVAQALADAASPIVPEAPPGGPHTPMPAEPPSLPTVQPHSASGPPVSSPTLAPTPVRPPLDRTIPLHLRVALRISGGISGGVLPRTSGELGLLVALLGRHWRLDLLARGDLPTLIRSATAPDIGVRLGLWAVGARGCVVPRRARFEFPLCAGAEVGQVIGRGEGLPTNSRAALVWAAGTASPGLAWSPSPWLAIVASAQVALPLVRHDFVVRGLSTLHSLGPVQVGGSLALEWRFHAGPRPRPMRGP